MSGRSTRIMSVAAVVMGGLLCGSMPVAAQDRSAATAQGEAWTPPRTPSGQPDLQGYWTSLSFTPLERPEKYGMREFLTDEETAEVYKAGVNRSFEFTFANAAETPVYDATVYALDAWQNGVRPNRRTSLIVDPPNGQLPPLTPEAEGRPVRRRSDVFNGPEDLTTGVRCLTFGGPPIPAGSAYNHNTFIVQGPDHVIVEYEWGSSTRVIPLDSRPHLPSDIRPWRGDSRGRWEGDTLVVETTNFRPGTAPRNASENAQLTERFTRIDENTIEYKYTIDDPSTWTSPWTAIIPLSKIEGPMFEYACHEGNNGLVNMLEGARAQEK